MERWVTLRRIYHLGEVSVRNRRKAHSPARLAERVNNGRETTPNVEGLLLGTSSKYG